MMTSSIVSTGMSYCWDSAAAVAVLPAQIQMIDRSDRWTIEDGGGDEDDDGTVVVAVAVDFVQVSVSGL